MTTNFKPKSTTLIVFTLALFIMVPGFYNNTWHAAGKKWFFDWQKFHEHFIVARLVQSREEGFFSYGALLGYGDILTWEVNSDVINHEYDLYSSGGHFEKYWPYRSVPGLQAIPFALISQYSGLAPASNLKLFRLIEAIMSASVLGLFAAWLEIQFGLFTAILVILFMGASEWLTLFGANFYWNLWAFYLPLTVLCFYLQHTARNGQGRQRDIFLLLAGTLFVKCLFNGFEYISTALVMPFSAFVYYSVRDRWAFSQIFHVFYAAAAGALTGTIAALGILALQISAYLGGSEAIDYIAHTFGKRTFGDPLQYAGIEAESLQANLFSVLQTYLDGRALNLNGIFHANLPGLEISYFQIFSVFIIFSLLFLVRNHFLGSFPQRETGRALLITTWFSALAPLSWFVLFKPHSFIHTQMNFIIWQMPLMLYGFALCAFTLVNLFRHVGDQD